MDGALQQRELGQRNGIGRTLILVNKAAPAIRGVGGLRSKLKLSTLWYLLLAKIMDELQRRRVINLSKRICQDLNISS